jgi:predicted RNA-binding Zn-ribbon protein involved in translation (DUF1610 family)
MGTRSQYSQRAEIMAALRSSFAAAADDADAVDVTCRQCGEVFRCRRSKVKLDCPTCAASSQVSAADQMSAKQGPVYEKAARRQRDYWIGECERLGL